MLVELHFGPDIGISARICSIFVHSCAYFSSFCLERKPANGLTAYRFPSVSLYAWQARLSLELINRALRAQITGLAIGPGKATALPGLVFSYGVASWCARI